MSAEKGNKDNLEHIRTYIQKHEPVLRGPGLPAPGGAPAILHGAATRGVAAGPGQGRKAQAGGAGPEQGRIPQRPDGFLRHVPEEARDLLDSIRSLAGQGLTPGQIAARLRLVEDGVRNVLAMGRNAYDPDAEAPAHTPEIRAYRNGFARRSW